jgi:hypothetical protein
MAEVRLYELMDEAAAAKPAPATVTFGQAVDEWLRYLEQEKGVAERTLSTNRGAARARLIPFFGDDTPLAEKVKIDFADSDFNFLTVEEVLALARAARASRTPPCTSPPPSPGSGSASCGRCGSRAWISSTPPSGCGGTCRSAQRGRRGRRAGSRVRCR